MAGSSKVQAVNQQVGKSPQTQYGAIFLAAAAAALGHYMLMGQSGSSSGFKQIVGLVSLAVAGFSGFTYVGSVFAFWHIQAAPSLKPWVYQLRCGVYFLAGLAIAASLGEYKTPFIVLPKNYLALALVLAGAYDLSITLRTRKLQTASQTAVKKATSQSNILDTGRLGDASDMQAINLFSNEGAFLGTLDNKPIFFKDAVHVITYGEPGCGKGANVVIPNLMNWTGSAVVTDPKGELAAVTADFRKNVLGQEIVYINPWRMHGLPNTNYNPLQLLLEDLAQTNDPNAPATQQHREIDDATALAEIILPEPANAGGDNKWVRDGARRMLKAFMLYLLDEHPDICTLVSLRNVLSLPDAAYEAVLQDMAQSPAFAGELATEGMQLWNNYSNTREQHEYSRDEAQKAVRLYDGYSHLGKAVINGAYSMTSLTRRPTTIYLMIPKDYKASHGSWMNLVVLNAIESIGRFGDRSRPTLCMLDEFANLGKMPRISNALAEYRGNGLRAWLIVQNQRQLKAVYGADEALSLEQLCNVQQYIGVNHEQAEALSARIGDLTVNVDSTGNIVQSFDDTYAEAVTTYSRQAKRILSASDIESKLKDKQQLTFISGRGFLLDKLPYWQVEPWRSNARDNPLEGAAPPVDPQRLIRV